MKNVIEGLVGNSILVSELLAECLSKGASVLFDGHSLGRGRHEVFGGDDDEEGARRCYMSVGE